MNAPALLRRWRRWWDQRWQAGRDAHAARVAVRCTPEVNPSTRDPEEWRVEAIDYENEGQVAVTIFSGRGAKARAFAYAAFQRKAPG